MCNRYHPARIADLAAEIGEFEPYRGNAHLLAGIGPFGTAVIARPVPGGGLQEFAAQWGMIRPGSPTRKAMKGKVPLMTNNARSETMAEKPVFKAAWANNQRCIIPAWAYDEPNWESGKNVWWSMKRADGTAWGIAGLYSTWTDPETAEVVESFTMPTINVDGHPLLSRLHKPEPDLPLDQQDKRAIVPLQPKDWQTWLHGSQVEALGLLKALPASVFNAGPVIQDQYKLI